MSRILQKLQYHGIRRRQKWLYAESRKSATKRRNIPGSDFICADNTSCKADDTCFKVLCPIVSPEEHSLKNIVNELECHELGLYHLPHTVVHNTGIKLTGNSGNDHDYEFEDDLGYGKSDNSHDSGCYSKEKETFSLDWQLESPVYLRATSNFKRVVHLKETQFIKRRNPFPSSMWTDVEDVWQAMERKERRPEFFKDANIVSRHPGIEPRMRSILVDWLIEVAEVYKMHRETLYLSVDYIDRYLSRAFNVKKTQLQLIGVTALFIAAKTEEVHPVHLVDFAYITDGACSEDEILEQELVMLQVLQWDMTSLTPLFWIGSYLQTLALNQTSSTDRSCLQLRFSRTVFVQCMRVLDLVMLDIGSAIFSSSILAAAVIYHVYNQQIASLVSGYTFADIKHCVRWMEPFVRALNEEEVVELKSFVGVRSEDAHNIQTHLVDLKVLDAVQSRVDYISSFKLSEEMRPDCPTPLASTCLTPSTNVSSHCLIRDCETTSFLMFQTPPNSQTLD